jgi:hypothetical protein
LALRVPEISSHGFPTATPQIGQGTEDICFRASVVSLK